MRWVLATLFLPAQFFFVLGGKNFHLGRSKGGNIGDPVGSDGEPLPEAKWFTQRLDHTSSSNLNTWKQRYFVNDEYYDKNNTGPVFLMIGGEGPASPKWMVKGAWIEYAKYFKALCFQLEHRYYGESHPTENISTKNLQYLSSSHALDDIAYFIEEMNKRYKLPHDTKWVAFGGSYPGSLAAWVRVKYPHLVYASVSSSGPLLAKVDFKEYFKVVVDALREKTGDDECIEQVKLAHEQIAILMIEQPHVIEKEFNVCRIFFGASADDIKNFYTSLADDFAELVQYNEDNRIGVQKKYRNVTINTVCKLLTEDKSKPAYKRLAEFHRIVMNENNITCFDYSYNDFLQTLRNVSWGGDEARQWMYQTCTEFGFYQTSSAEINVFGDEFPLDFFVQQCEEVFGTKFNIDFINKAADWTNIKYGGLDIAVSRVVFVHGSVDPWHALGITHSTHKDAPAIFINGTAHCANMYPPSDNDLPALKDARKQIQQHLADWIGLP